MKSLGDALAEILSHVGELEAEDAPLRGCVGQALATNVYADHDLPSLDLCGPDGYAVRSEDISGASPQNPAVLRVLGGNRAGHLPRHQLRQGMALRVMTGSPVPLGADCVVPFEQTDEPGDKNGPGPRMVPHVKVFQECRPGANINPAGSNLRKGMPVAPRGTVIGPAQISVLASVGAPMVKVIRRARVAIMSTGDELVRLGRPLRPGTCYDSNSPALAVLVTHCGGIPFFKGISKDNVQSLAAKLRTGLTADAIITSGGVSKGDYDLVRLLLERMGRVVFSRLDTGPGASFAFGTVSREAGERGAAEVPVFAIAGPPSGCLVNFETLVRPALLKMMGCAVTAHPTIEATAVGSVTGRRPMSFVKWTHLEKVDGVHQVVVNLAEERGLTGAMATANSLTIIPRGTEVAAGDRLQVLPLDWAR